MNKMITSRTGEKFYNCCIHHLGMVGAFIRETGIMEKIDEMIPKLSNNTSFHSWSGCCINDFKWLGIHI